MKPIDKFHQHDALTVRVPRTIREAENDPRAWWAEAEAAAAEEDNLRAMFNEPDSPARASVWADRAIMAIAAGVVVWFSWGLL